MAFKDFERRSPYTTRTGGTPDAQNIDESGKNVGKRFLDAEGYIWKFVERSVSGE